MIESYYICYSLKIKNDFYCSFLIFVFWFNLFIICLNTFKLFYIKAILFVRMILCFWYQILVAVSCPFTITPVSCNGPCGRDAC